MNDLRIEDARWAPVDIGKTLEKSWKTFMNAPVPWVLAALIYLVIFLVLFGIYFIGIFSLANTSPQSGGIYDPAAQPAASSSAGIGFFIFIAVIFSLVFFVILLQSVATYRCAAMAFNGQPIKVSSFFNFGGAGLPILTFFVVGLIIGIGYMLCFIPGIVAAIYLFFAYPAVLNMQNPTLQGALKASIAMFKANPGPTFLAMLFCVVINSVGQAVVFGTIIAVPLCALFSTLAFRSSVTGEFAMNAPYPQQMPPQQLPPQQYPPQYPPQQPGFGGPGPQDPPFPPQP
ncbi:hypothetical protein [Corynebacterium freiburgense]|uniref:hypothetical protein n=1 Tax=Corynebacterium freiburgense TaxID=556548 RepID=UPI00040D276A|nr:hypothetical protein [Corynebacterium freiburgense]WJZ03520.1 hypothetical protein CFREI_11260 [Corynebacterium freiburgense]